MSTLTGTHAALVDLLTPTGVAVLSGPPFAEPPAGPCFVVGPPSAREVVGTCEVTETSTEVWVLPTIGANMDELLTLTDTAIDALGARVDDGTADQSPFTEVPSIAYRLTVE